MTRLILILCLLLSSCAGLKVEKRPVNELTEEEKILREIIPGIKLADGSAKILSGGDSWQPHLDQDAPLPWSESDVHRVVGEMQSVRPRKGHAEHQTP